MGQLLRFAAVGCVGFAVDVAMLQLLRAAGAGLLWGRAGSFLVAATTTWALNRRYTFDDRAATAGPAPPAANGCGFSPPTAWAARSTSASTPRWCWAAGSAANNLRWRWPPGRSLGSPSTLPRPGTGYFDSHPDADAPT